MSFLEHVAIYLQNTFSRTPSPRVGIYLESMLFYVYAIILCYALLEVVHGQYPRFEHKGSILGIYSFVNRKAIGTGDDALKCVTNNAACCTDSDVGNWTDPEDAAVHQGMNEGYDLYVTRGDG